MKTKGTPMKPQAMLIVAGITSALLLGGVANAESWADRNGPGGPSAVQGHSNGDLGRANAKQKDADERANRDAARRQRRDSTNVPQIWQSESDNKQSNDCRCAQGGSYSKGKSGWDMGY